MSPATPLDALFARGQMAYSLGFHIIFAAVGIAMPLLMVMAEIRWLRTGDGEYLDLARRWAKGTAVFFAVGAVSGTVLSLELGLLFPGFMHHAGAIVGLPFSLEGFAFFTEAIFLGLYLYAWQRISPRLHIAAGFVVAASGLASAVFVTIVNAWMNAPLGFEVEYGRLVNIDPIAAMRSPFITHEVLHTSLSAYMATAFAVLAIHAWALLRPNPTRVSFHRKAIGLALAMAIPAALAQPLVGHLAGQQVAQHQPLKFAAMESVKLTQVGAPLHIGPISIPGGLSFMAFSDSRAEVKGLDAFPPEDHPHPIVHVAFLGMVALGLAAAAFAAVTLVWWIRRRSLPDHRRWLQAALVLGPSGLVATELGWIVTEVGRQPWTVYGVLRTHDLVTPVGGLWLPFVSFAIIYLLLGAVVAVTLWKQVRPTTDAPEAK
jgi:cytochrome bd ubiquinol oxidase subunit I